MNLGPSLFALVVIWFSNFQLGDAAAEPLRIGALLCQTGSCAATGTASLNGVQLAIEEENRQGGFGGQPIELVVEDSIEDSPQLSVTAYRNLRRHGVNIVVGPTWSAAGRVLMPIIKADSTALVISPSLGIKEFSAAADNIFNIWPNDEIASRYIARAAIAKGFKKIAILGAEQPWSLEQAQAFKDEYMSLGGSVVFEAFPAPESRDLKAEALSIAKSHAQAVVFTCFAEQMGVAAFQLQKLQFKGRKLSVLMYPESIAAAHGALEGAEYAEYLPPSQDFQARFQARFGTLPGTGADKGYDAAKLIVRSARRVGGLDADAIRSELRAVKGYVGASGDISFTNARGVLREPVMFAVRNGAKGYSVKGPIPESAMAQMRQ